MIKTPSNSKKIRTIGKCNNYNRIDVCSSEITIFRVSYKDISEAEEDEID